MLVPESFLWPQRMEKNIAAEVLSHTRLALAHLLQLRAPNDYSMKNALEPLLLFLHRRALVLSACHIGEHSWRFVLLPKR